MSGSTDPMSPIVRDPKPTRSRPCFDAIVMAASAGGIQALSEVLGSLPADLPVPVVVVQHRPEKSPDLLPRVLGRHTFLPVKTTSLSERLHPGTVYLAPAGLHLQVLADRTVIPMDGRRIQHVLSSANPLFTSASEVYDGRLIAVVLSGSGSDAAEGVRQVKAHGGTAIAQDKATSAFFGMPHAAIATGCIDRVLAVQDIGPALVHLVDTGSFPDEAAGIARSE